jgi:presenilin 1
VFDCAQQAWFGVLCACFTHILTHIPESTSWVLLVIMALYDLAAVLLPGGLSKVAIGSSRSKGVNFTRLCFLGRNSFTLGHTRMQGNVAISTGFIGPAGC